MLPTSHVGQNQVFEADRLDGPCLLQHRAIGPNDETALSVRVTGVDHLLIGRVAVGITAGADEPVVRVHEVIHVTCELDP